MTAFVDAKERSRIEHEGLDETLFVEAGAGTGKTFELVERVVNLVLEAGVPLRRIAAITFTEAAASELRDRVREAFERRLAAHERSAGGAGGGAEGDGAVGEVAAACRRALADLDQAAIGTLHGFCLRILNEHPLEVDLPPRIEILDEVASQLAFQERWDEFVDLLFGSAETEELVLRAWALNIEVDTASRFKASFKDVASVFEDSWDRLEGLAAQAPLTTLTPIDLVPLRDAVEAMVRVREANRPMPGDTLLARSVEIEASVARVFAESDPLRQLAALCASHTGWRIGNQRGNKTKWLDVDAVRDAVTAVGDAGAAIVRAASDEVLRQLAIRLAHFTLGAAEQRRAVGHLVFHDLLVLARRLLQTSAEARLALHDKYERLLLDEFQDTDPIQVEVAVRIAAAVEGVAADGDGRVGGGVGVEPWDEVATEPGRLFFVGDPKQSIYRFRRADIRLFLAARDRFSADAGGPVQLGHNFRTVEPILDWVNDVFGSLMSVEVEGAQPAYAPLSANRTELGPGIDHRVLLLGGARDAKAGVLRDEEAVAVAETIASIGAERSAWLVQDEETKAWREPRWQDITILIPTRTSLRQLEDALDVEGVPYRVATGSLVFDTQEVREALDALRAIDDPGDELSLVSALRSPLYACSDVDLFTWRSAGGRWDLRRPTGSVPVDPSHPVAVAMRHLKALADDRWWLEPSALLDRLLRERHAFVLAFGSRRPREVWRRLRFLVDQARAFEESAGGGGLRGFLAWAELQRTEGTRVHEPLMAETDDDAVSILTIHGAKGLEFPITVLSGMTTLARGRRKGPTVIWDGDLPAVRFNKDTSTENFDRLADLEAEMDVYERLRLLYVGCTRARDHLVVSCFHKPSANSASFGQLLTEHTPADVRRRYVAAGDVHRPEVPAPAEPAVPSMPMMLPFDDRDGWLAAREALLAPHRRPRFLSATAIAGGEASEPEATAEPEAEAEAEAEVPGGPDDEVRARVDLPWRRGRAGTAIGRAVHATLQFCPADGRGLVELATRHAHLEAVPDDVDTIVALARSALDAPSVQAGHAAARSWRELYVAAAIGTRAVEGYVDLLFERDDGALVLVDYKTDSVTTEAEIDAKVERYALQTAVYALALERSTGLRVSEARLVFAKKGGAIERVVEGLDERRELVEKLLA